MKDKQIVYVNCTREVLSEEGAKSWQKAQADMIFNDNDNFSVFLSRIFCSADIFYLTEEDKKSVLAKYREKCFKQAEEDFFEEFRDMAVDAIVSGN